MEENGAIVISNYHHGEVYEARNEFKHSMFHRVYRRAYDVVQDSVCRQLSDSKNGFFQENIDNIVTFVGRRGTGKSSAMISFMQGLLDNNKGEEAPNYTIYKNQEKTGEKVRFISIDWIDASLLEQGEDIFEEILAKMLKEFLQKDEKGGFSGKHDYYKKDLYRKFDGIYKKHLSVKKRVQTEEFASEMAISNLRDLARSSDIRKEFQELVELYIRMKEDFYYGEKIETFLVVAIDDLDMNVNAGFEILEKIQRYLRVKHLIVLLAVNQEQMKLCCERHFAGMFEKQIGYKVENKKRRIGDLADQYMEKALPSYTRVYLPSLKKMDYDRNHVTKVMLDGEQRQEVSIKMAVFITMWRKTRVRYDVEGKKRHFMEPESLRDLNNTGIFRRYMQDLSWGRGSNQENFLEQLDFNYRRCMDDLLFRYANEILTGEENKFFLQLSEMDIRRRGEMIVTRFCSKAEESKKNEFTSYEEQVLRTELLAGYRTFKYSYGEMLHALYCMGRMDLYEKPLVHAILAMYSLTLTKIFYRYKAGKEEKNGKDPIINKERQYNALKELIGDSVGGSWSRQLVPCLRMSENEERDEAQIFYAGAAKNTRAELVIDFSGSEYKNASTEAEDKKKKTAYEDFTQDEKREIEWKFILFLFLSNTAVAQYETLKKAPEDERAIVPSDMKENKEELKVTIRNVDYNIMNFVNNIFMFEDKVKEFVRKICTEEIGSKITAVIEKSKKRGNSGFWGKMVTWH